jgi:hypothetical protein
MRRLRARLPPNVPVLVGLWPEEGPEEDDVLNDERLRVAVGANYFASSLREAVATCVEVLSEVGAGHEPVPLTA